MKYNVTVVIYFYWRQERIQAAVITYCQFIYTLCTENLI